jgi:hypothetical protein
VTSSKAKYNGGAGIAMGGKLCSIPQGGYNQLSGSDASNNDGNGIDLGSDTDHSEAGYGNVTDSVALNNYDIGIVLPCPGNASTNTALNNSHGNLVTIGTGCTLLANKAP